jgi:CheY-like chemotaxis protein
MTNHAVHTDQVLVIDDDVDMRDVVQIILEDAGYTVTVAPDGAAALEVLRQAARLPDLILLDLGMPVLDGRAFRHAQQADSQWRTIPVIAVSAEREVHATAAALGIGAVLPKPFTLAELLDTVQRYCA